MLVSASKFQSEACGKLISPMLTLEISKNFFHRMHAIVLYSREFFRFSKDFVNCNESQNKHHACEQCEIVILTVVKVKYKPC